MKYCIVGYNFDDEKICMNLNIKDGTRYFRKESLIAEKTTDVLKKTRMKLRYFKLHIFTCGSNPKKETFKIKKINNIVDIYKYL